MFVAAIQTLENLTLEKITAMIGSARNADPMKNWLNVGFVKKLFLKIISLSIVSIVIIFIILIVPIFHLKNSLSVIPGDATVALKKIFHFLRYKTKILLSQCKLRIKISGII